VCAGTFHNTTLYITILLTGSSFIFFLFIANHTQNPYLKQTHEFVKSSTWQSAGCLSTGALATPILFLFHPAP